MPKRRTEVLFTELVDKMLNHISSTSICIEILNIWHIPWAQRRIEQGRAPRRFSRKACRRALSRCHFMEGASTTAS